MELFKEINDALRTGETIIIYPEGTRGDDNTIKEFYDKFIELYKTTPRTLCHDDLLPINVLVNDKEWQPKNWSGDLTNFDARFIWNDGKNIYYSLADDHVKTILRMGLEHVMCE